MKKILERYRTYKRRKQLVRDYPGDIAYNVGRVMDMQFIILSIQMKTSFLFKKEGLELIHVNQGYTNVLWQ